MARTCEKLGAALTAALVCLASLALLPTSPAGAQATPGAPGTATLSVSPPTASFDATPGGVITHKIGLDNVSDIPRNITVSVDNFEANGEQGEAQLTDELGPYSLAQWVTVTPKTAKITPHGHQDFQIKIAIPKNAPPGGHFGAIKFTPAPVKDANGANVEAIPEVSSLLLLRVPGSATEKASIASIAACKPPAKPVIVTTCNKGKSFFNGGPITFTLRIANQGNVQVQPQGTLTIYNMFGSKVDTIKVDPKYVLPDSVRRFDIPWKHSQLLGMYTAKFALTYGSSSQELRKSTSVWGAPTSFFIGAGIAILAFFFLIWLPRKRIKKAFKALASSSD